MNAPTTSGRWRGRTAATIAVFSLLAGCATDSISDRRLARYRPDSGGRRVGRWGSTGFAGTSAAPSTNQPPDNAVWLRPLKKGDRITLIIQLTSSRLPEQRSDMIDGAGSINLWLIGAVKIEGKTTSEAEALIEKAYREGKFFSAPSVTVTVQEDQYYVQGEVRRPGPYLLRGDVTLRQAIAAAGGPTEFADLGDVKIKRKDRTGQKVIRFDVKKIDKGKEPDPPIQPDDLVEVGRTWVGLGGI
ncbi:MAG: SLBB domain-containing protein [Verrucomicrobiota bacterium]|nr:SLBB domain-containing protein [Verrucomicrobiota bacterium]